MSPRPTWAWYSARDAEKAGRQLRLVGALAVGSSRWVPRGAPGWLHPGSPMPGSGRPIQLTQSLMGTKKRRDRNETVPRAVRVSEERGSRGPVGSVGGVPLQRRGAGAGGLRPHTSAARSGVRRQRAEPAPRVEEMEGAHQAGLFYFRDVIQDPVFEDSVL